jgi:dipeptidyl aminopeptidase/acylaminoacyl peptidase
MRRLFNSMVIPNTRKARVRACPERPSRARKSNGNLLFAAAILLSFAAFAAAQAKHPFTFDDMMKLKRVGEPEVSPDGKWVIFSVVDVDLAANTKTPHIWIVPVEARAGDAHVGTAALGRPAEQGSAGSLSAERVLIPDQDGDRPRWAPDGKRFAFLSTKADGSSQVWIADFDNTAGSVKATHRLTQIATEAGGELWSPDGKNILFTSDVYPECDGQPEAEKACNAKRLAQANESKVKAQIFDHLLYRHWNAYKEGKRSHIFVTPAPPLPGAGGTEVASGAVGGPPIDLTPGDYDAPVFSLGGQDDYAFSPDGQELCYASNHDKNPAASTNNDLWIVPVSGGQAGSVQAKNITADNPASDTSPLYSPDGRYIAYRAQQRPGYESDRFRLMLYDRKTGEKKNLTENLDGWVGSFTWAGRHEIYFTSEKNGESQIFWVVPEVCPNGCHPVMSLGGFNDDLSIVETETKDERGGYVIRDHFAFSRMSIGAPTEIYALGNADYVVRADKLKAMMSGESKEPLPEKAYAKPLQLTHLNDAVLSQVAMSPLESFWFTGAHNDKVEGFLVKPPNFDASKKYPVKFLIHGGPQGAWGDDWSYRWNPELFASPTSATPSGYVVIMINFHGSTGYGQKFIDAINGDWGGAPFEDLMKGLDYAEQTYPFIDKNRECALGASYGGYMINWILGHTDRFKCLVSHDGMFNAESAWGTTEELWFNDWEFKGTPYDNRASYEKWSPHQYAKNFKTPTLVIHGQRDYRLDVSEGFQLFTTLQMEGVPSKMLYFPDEGHWVLKPQNSKLWYETVNAWVDRWIGDQRMK